MPGCYWECILPCFHSASSLGVDSFSSPASYSVLCYFFTPCDILLAYIVFFAHILKQKFSVI